LPLQDGWLATVPDHQQSIRTCRREAGYPLALLAREAGYPLALLAREAGYPLALLAREAGL